MTSTTEWNQSSDYRQGAGRRPHPLPYHALDALVAVAASIFACGGAITNAPFWQGPTPPILAEDIQ